MPIIFDATASYGNAAGVIEHAALDFAGAWMFKTTPEAARAPRPFFLRA